MALTTTISSSATQDDSQATAIGGANGKTSAINTSTTITMAEGTGAGQADLTLQKTITLNAGNSYEDNINIFDGTEEDEFGVVFNIKEVKAIYFEVISDPVVALANCEVFADQAAPSNEFKGPLNDVTGDGLTIEAAQAMNVVNSQLGGWTVDATHKFLVFVNANSTDTTINVFIIGVKV